MRIDILTIFPSMFQGVFDAGLLAKACSKGVMEVRVHDLRAYTDDVHHTVDDAPYGGGGGMVFKPEPIFRAVDAVSEASPPDRRAVILLTPRGRVMDQRRVEELAGFDQLIVICGRYEGVDERVARHLATHEVSLGDYVLSGGEIAAMALAEAVSRLVPGVLGNPESAANDSFSGSVLEFPQYTRPADFRGLTVPEVLLSGNHEAIRRYRKEEAIRCTLQRRPELLNEQDLDGESRRILATLSEGEFKP